MICQSQKTFESNEHNIYKSDVFSIGLLFYQLAVMDDVTGFNQKSQEYDGEKLAAAGVENELRNFSSFGTYLE